VTRVYADMVADLFHHGHAEFLRQARALGDVLVVGIHSDEVVESYKRAPLMTMDERIRVVEACRYVDEVIPDAPLAVTKDWIERHRLDLVVHGDDIDGEETARMYETPAAMGILRTVPYTAGISTSELLRRLAQRLGQPESGVKSKPSAADPAA
jgi:glycerol-3-phosphate cytidylyltransferase